MKCVKNIYNLSFLELMYELLSAEDFYFFSKIDFHNHIKKITDGFNSDQMFFLFQDLHEFIGSEIYISYGKNEKYSLDYICREKPKEKIIDYSGANWVDDIFTIDQKISVAFVITQDNNDLEFETKHGSIHVFDYYEIFSTIAEAYGINFSLKREGYYFMFEMKIDKNNGEEITKKSSKKMKVLNFIDLFNIDYTNVSKIQELKKWLQRERFINDDEILICNYTNAARIYFILREESIIRPNNNITSDIRCFFKEFGVNVVETKDEDSNNPQVVRRTVTGDDAKNTKSLEANDGTGTIYNKAKNKLIEIFKTNKY